MSPQLIQIAECLNEANTREIKIARCLAESLKRIQELEQSKTEASQQAKEAEKRFNAALHDLAEQMTKTGEETTSIAQHLSNQINTEKKQFSAELTNVVDQLTKTSEQAKVEFGYKVDEIALKLAELPEQLAAFKAEFATPAVQADASKSFNPRGAYESGKKYQPFDYVSANGSSYIALVENPTEPPSKRSKQWMLVAARGASGSGGIISASEVVGLGTAATRDVGQAAGNVLEMSADNTFGSISIQVIGGQVSAFSNFQLGSNSTLIYGASVNDVTLTCPNTSGTIALLSQVGDRYLTSSTTSLTLSNGAKTLTVGTGLAYSPTQDVTIAYDVSKHMHASVTSYNSTTGVLVVDVQQHTGTGTYAIWTVNVGGISSTGVPVGGDTGAFLVKASASNYDTTWTTVGTFSTLDVSGTAAIGTQNETWVAVGGSNLFPTIAADSLIYDDVDLLFAPKGYGQCVFGNSGWLYTTAASGAGSLLLNNGADDSPNIKFCFSNYGNFGIDTAAGDWGGPFSNLLSQSLRFISQSDEVGGAVIAALDSAGNFAILGGFSLSKTITSSGTTGAQTINSSSGSVNFASAATSLVVTNSLVTTESVIHVTKATNNSIARLGAAVAANGSFTIYMDVAPTTEIRVNFIITN